MANQLSRARSALALLLGWAPFLQRFQNQSLHPIRRQPLAHLPRVNRALWRTNGGRQLSHRPSLNLRNKVHAPTKKKNAQCARKDLRNAAQCAA